MNTPEEHAAAVLRAPGPITAASIAGAIRAYADEIKGSQIADADKLAAVTAERDAERAARKALFEALEAAGKRCDYIHHAKADQHCGMHPCPVEARIAAALALAAKLP